MHHRWGGGCLRHGGSGGEARGGRRLGQREMALTGNDDAFKYDIAFSFVREDEGLATQLNDLVQDRFRTFLYSKAQDQLVGADGEKTIPPWLPKTRIWFDLERFGLNGAATLLEARVQEHGGTAVQETLADRAVRLRRAQEFN